jgi:hypothetical protein
VEKAILKLWLLGLEKKCLDLGLSTFSKLKFLSFFACVLEYKGIWIQISYVGRDQHYLHLGFSVLNILKLTNVGFQIKRPPWGRNCVYNLNTCYIKKAKYVQWYVPHLVYIAKSIFFGSPNGSSNGLLGWGGQNQLILGTSNQCRHRATPKKCVRQACTGPD